MGEPDKANLQAELERAGWRVERRNGDDWWEHESWELTSTWRPNYSKVWLTLLIDPQSKTSEISAVWAIGVTLEKPTDRMEAGRSAIRVAPRWPERMKEIVTAVSSLRPSN
jgi:hypothetical protein